MPSVQFDGNGFYAALDAVREERKLTWRKVAEQSGGVSASCSRGSRKGRDRM